MKTYAEVLEEFKNSMKENFTDQINTSNQSNMIRLMYPILNNVVTKYEKLQYFLDMRNIYKAEGLWLDYLLSNFNFIRKQANYATTTWFSSNSVPGTIVNAGELQVSDGLDHIFVNTSSGTVDINGEIIFNLAALVSGSDYNLEAETLTTIVNSISGIGTGSNPTSITDGQDYETDYEFRIRFLSGRTGRSFWNIDGIYKSLFELDGVTSVFVDENDTGATVGILPAHSIICVVEGGIDNEIAQAIFRASDQAIKRYGNTSIEIEDLQGETRTIDFYRPDTVNVEYQYGFTGSATSTKINTAIQDYINDAGVRATLSTYQAIKYIESQTSLSQVTSIYINFRRQGDSTWLSTLTLDITEKGNAVLVT